MRGQHLRTNYVISNINENKALSEAAENALAP